VPGRDVDEVQWEVAGSRWAAVGDGDQRNGVALLTEAKYGFACRDGRLSVSLLRAPAHPDPGCDRGRHQIALAIGRHHVETTSDHLCTSAAAEALFTPALTVSGGSLAEPPFTLEDTGSLVPSWVTPSETKSGFIVRLHETAGHCGIATLRLTKVPASVELVDFLERPIGSPERVNDCQWRVEYEPYAILSILVAA
jgi:alpha-mannosidase